MLGVLKGAVVTAAMLLTAGVACGAQAACKLSSLADFPLKPNPSRALVEGEINDRPVLLILDTGAFFSSIPAPDAQRLGMSAYKIGSVGGIGGSTQAGEGEVKLKLGNFTYQRKPFAVLQMGSLDNQASGLLGREFVSQHDLELDLPDHQVRILIQEGCQPDGLVYWNKPYSLVKLERGSSDRPEILMEVKLNGRMILAELDSGAAHSIITSGAARAVGARVDASPAQPTNLHGVGEHTVTSGAATLDTFTIGDETIKNAKVVVSDMWKYNREEQMGTLLGGMNERADSPRMLLGADFLRSHRVLVSNSLHVMVFSYVGGPVFDLAEARVANDRGAAPPGGRDSAH